MEFGFSLSLAVIIIVSAMKLACSTGPGKPGKSWNLIMAFSRTGKSWKKPLALEIC